MLIISALLYLLPVIYPYATYPCLFLWMIPLLIGDKNNTYGYKQGFTWGLIFYSGHLYWLAYTLCVKRQVCTGIIAYAFLVLYLSLFSALWLWGKQQIYARYVKNIVHTQQDQNVAFCLTW